MDVDIKELKKMARALNKLELTDEPIDVKQELDALQEDFIQAIEEIDDAGKVDDVDDKILDFYEALIEGNGKKKEEIDFDDMDKDELLEFIEEKELDIKKSKAKKMKSKELRALVAETWEDMQGEPGKGEEEINLDELRDDLEEMTVREMKQWCEDNDVETDTKITKDNLDDCIEEIIEVMEERTGKKKDKKDKKKDKKDKAARAKKDPDLPKGLVTGSLPAEIYKKIADGGKSMKKLAEFVAKKKDRDVEKCYGEVYRIIVRKVAPRAPISALMKDSEPEMFFSLAENED